MVQRTINGWPVISSGSDPALKLFTIPGTKRRMRLRKDVGGYLVAFVSEYHKLVQPIDEGIFDDWAWSPPRKGRASSKISDHCAGVAVDVNAAHPDGRQGHGLSWWLARPVKYRRLKKLLKKYRLLEAGITYKNFIDPMHYVIKTPSPTAVKAEMKRLGITPSGNFKAIKAS